MNKFQGKLVAGLGVVVFFGALGSAQAQVQVQVQPPVAAPAMPPMETPPPPMMPAPQPMVVAPAPAMMLVPAPQPVVAAPKVLAPDDMSGQWGFGVGVGASAATTSLVSISPTNSVYVRYWLSDSLSILPTLQLKLAKAKDVDASWAFDPALLFLYCPWKTTSTRLTIGAGLGLAFQKWGGTSIQTPPTTAPPSDTSIGITLPIFAGVEHFFTKWFSMGIGVYDNFLAYNKLGDAWTVALSLDDTRSITPVGFLFFYTD